MNVQLDILLGRLQSFDNPLHGFITKKAVICALYKKRSFGLIAIKRFQHKPQGFFSSVDQAVNRRLGDGLVALRVLEVSRDTELGID